MIKFFRFLLVCVLCVFCVCGKTYSAGNEPLGDIVEATWINQDNMERFSENISNDLNEFQNNFETTVKSPGFVPIEAKIGLALMKAFYNISDVLQMSLVPFTKIFLLVMYAFWIAIEAHKLIRDSGDYKTVLYDVFKKGVIIAVWLMILSFGFEKIFMTIISPIISLGTYLSDSILNTTAQTYDATMPDTCTAIHNYVNTHNSGKMLIDANTGADIMCLPGRISTYFYYATATGFKWMLYGFTHSVTAICVGAVSIYVFIKCIFKYAFMTLGVVVDLLLTILMLPFTAIAESMPTTDDKGYVGQIYSEFLKLFNTKKLSDIIAKFVNAAVYFVSLSIVISICAALLAILLPLNGDYAYSVPAAMTALLTGWMVLHLANKADELAKKLGGSIDNSFGQTLQNDSKTLFDGAKKIGSMVFKDWIKK